jgi:WD repeat-containing protein 22
MPGSDEVFLSAGDDNSVMLWDARNASKPQGVLQAKSAFNSVEFSPEDQVFVTGNSLNGAQLWDLRTSFGGTSRNPPKSLLNYNIGRFHDASAACFNSSGTHLVCTIRKSTPMLFKVNEKEPIALLSNSQYKNVCTMKAAIFGGPFDEYILSGSDDFRIYIWKVPSSEEMEEFCKENKDEFSDDSALPPFIVKNTKEILLGHRSIVNNLRYHPTLPILASSGVEKIIKFWSPFPMKEDDTSDIGPQPRRRVYTNEMDLLEELSTVQSHGRDQSTEEDPKTLALFDFFNRFESGAPSSDDDEYFEEEDDEEDEFEFLSERDEEEDEP